MYDFYIFPIAGRQAALRTRLLITRLLGAVQECDKPLRLPVAR